MDENLSDPGTRASGVAAVRHKILDNSSQGATDQASGVSQEENPSPKAQVPSFLTTEVLSDDLHHLWLAARAGLAGTGLRVPRKLELAYLRIRDHLIRIGKLPQ